MKLSTPLSQALGLSVPIVQAPMAGGPANRFLREAEAKHFPQLAIPAQNNLTVELPAAELIARPEAETIEAIRRIAAHVKE